MSHVAENKTVIKTVNEAVLQETLELIAKVTPGITIDQQIGTYEGTKQTVDVAVHTPGMPRGIGLKFRKQEGLSFIGDGYGVSAEYSRIQKLILSTYQVVATRKALATMGYTTKVAGEALGKVRLEAIRA